MTTRFPGWTAVGAAFVVAIFSAGVGTYGPPIFLQTLHATRGWPISGVSAAVTTHFLSSAVVVAFLPDLHHRFGLALATAGGGILIALGTCAWGSAERLWQLFPAAVLSGSGLALIGGAAIAAIVARWFDRDRPRALSLALNGASVGGMLLPPVWTALIASLGFRAATATVGAVVACTIVTLARHFLRQTPGDLGLLPDGVPSRTSHPAPAWPASSRVALLRRWRFLSLSLSFALGLFAQIGVLSQIIVRLAPVMGSDGAVMSLTVATACSLLGRTVLGWTIGERERRVVAASNFAVQAGGVLLLTVGEQPILLILGCAVFGLGIGNLTSLPPLIAQAEFEPGDVGTVVALTTAVNQAVFGLAPLVLGILHDVTGSYTVPFALALVLQMSATAIMLASRRPRT